MKISKIALSLLIATCAAPVFATDLRSYNLSDYNCEEGSDIEVKACLETTLSEKVANLSEVEYHFNKAVDDARLSTEATADLKKLFGEEKEAYKLYGEKQCNLKISIESKQNTDIKLERLVVICQINTLDNRIDALKEFTNDLTNDFIASKSPEDEPSNTPIKTEQEQSQTEKTEYINPNDSVSDMNSKEDEDRTEIIDNSESFTHGVKSTDQVPSDVDNEDTDDLN